ncbi:hypothetical protein [Halocatena salina]|uniref:Uncharacterized protein n=1 Tax=Halocatena salina TaxID=2934340 RepID=A0A8U0A1X8_9EURY|nr:hypothetical protein [Halocatena salina]UPM43150.1 hypothetical protein MW046_01570 [Halocatena salina]
MANRTNTQTVGRITDLRINDHIQVRSLETGREDAFIVDGFELNVIEGRPEITVQLRTPHDEPGPIVLFNTPGGICLSPTDVPQRQNIEAEVALYEGNESQAHQRQ